MIYDLKYVIALYPFCNCRFDGSKQKESTELFKKRHKFII